MRLLLVEPDIDYADVIQSVLAKGGWEIDVVRSAAEAEQRARDPSYGLAIVNAEVSNVAAQPIIATLRASLNGPVIALVDGTGETAGDEFIEQGASFDLRKPFSPRRLRSVLRAVLRDTEDAAKRHALPEKLEGNGHVVSIVRHEVEVDGRRVVLSPREYALFQTLGANPGRVFSRSELAETAWGASEGKPSLRQVDVYIGYLRRKLESNPRRPHFILTRRGAGYAWRAEGT